MLTSEEHREACRVYMQKYRSKPENREKIRQQNAEYRKRKKMESIRQVSEIGSLEQTVDGFEYRIKMLESDLKEALYKISLYEQESRIPQSHVTHITALKHQLDAKQCQLDAIFNAANASLQADSVATAYQSLVNTIQLIANPGSVIPSSGSSSPITTSTASVSQQQQGHSPSLSSASNTPSPSPKQFSSNSSHSNLAHSSFRKSLDQSTKELYFSSNNSRNSSPPSSPSLHFTPTSPSSPFSLNTSTGMPSLSIHQPSTPTSSAMLSSPFSLQAQQSFGLVPESLLPSQQPHLPALSKSTNTISLSHQPTTSPSTSPIPSASGSNANHPLSLLCDVLQNETSLQTHQRPLSSPSNESKTNINFVLNSGKGFLI